MQNITDLDLELASVFYPILVDYAKRMERLSYNDLKREAASRFPGVASEIDRCTDQAVGRRLDVIRLFTNESGYPDLTCLVVNRQTGECGQGFVGNPEEERLRVAAHDWSAVADFNARIKAISLSAARKRQPRLSEAEAKAIMWDYAKSAGVTKVIPLAQRNRIIELIRNHSDPAEAFRESTA